MNVCVCLDFFKLVTYLHSWFTTIANSFLLRSTFMQYILLQIWTFYRSSHRRCSIRKLFLKISQYSQENTYVGNLSECNGIRTHNHLVRKRTWLTIWVNDLSKWFRVPLRTIWLWVPIPWKSLKLQLSRLFRAKNSLTFSQL